MIGTLVAVEVPPAVVALGAIVGMTYGLLAVGLVLVHRSNRIVNFSHGEVGAFAAVVLGALVGDRGWPYYAALPVALGVGAALGAAVQVVVVRRLEGSPRLMGVVATLGVGQLLVVGGLLLDAEAGASGAYPSPPGLPTFQLGDLKVTQAYAGMLLVAPIVVGALAVFLARSRVGTALRASAENPDAARLAAIPAARMSALAWALAGGLSALTAVLVFPSRGFVTGESFGPSLLLRALTAAVVARMTSLPVAFVAGVGLGIAEQLLQWNTSQAGVVEVVLFVVVLVALALQGPLGGRREATGSWAAVLPARPWPAAVRRLRVVRWAGPVTAAVALAVGLALPAVLTNEDAATLIGVMGFAVVGLSVGVVTGLAGQLTLGQFGIAAVGAVVSYQVSSQVGSFPLAFAYAAVAGGGAAVVLGLPALRSRGLLLAVASLAFAVVVPAWLVTRSWAFGGGTDPGRPVLGDQPLDTARAYYYVVFGVLVIAVVVSLNLRRSGRARLFVAVRDNEDAARAFGVPASLVKVQALAVAGALAGLGGAAYAHAFANVGAPTFPVGASVDVVVMAVLGGVGTVVGPLLGAAVVVGLPAFVDLDTAGLVATRAGILAVLLAFPGGLVQAADPLRALVGRWLGRQVGGAVDDPAPPAATPSLPDSPVIDPAGGAAPAEVLLEARGLVRSFGGVRAVDGVDLTVARGEIVGLIGPNGAGKTTTFELLSGFVRPDAGTVHLAGRDVTAWSPERRAQAGLARSFQDAALFATLTVHDAVVVALEQHEPTSFGGALLGAGRAERRRRAAADEVLGRFGLHPYRDHRVQELSTGTRRIAELACLVAQRPAVLLLDEPAAGVAQREVEQLAGVLRGLRDRYGVALVVIEHDLPLVLSVADRVVAMDGGTVLVDDRPDVVRHHPGVVAAYLGTDALAVDRSDLALHA